MSSLLVGVTYLFFCTTGIQTSTITNSSINRPLTENFIINNIDPTAFDFFHPISDINENLLETVLPNSVGSSKKNVGAERENKFELQTAPSVCPAGQYISAQSCTFCYPGTYQTSPNSNMYCTVCPANTYGTLYGLTALAGCSLCPAGTYALSGSTQCYDCQPGMTSASGSACAVCPAGQYGDPYNPICDGCPAGQYGPMNSGFYSFKG